TYRYNDFSDVRILANLRFLRRQELLYPRRKVFPQAAAGMEFGKILFAKSADFHKANGKGITKSHLYCSGACGSQFYWAGFLFNRGVQDNLGKLCKFGS